MPRNLGFSDGTSMSINRQRVARERTLGFSDGSSIKTGSAPVVGAKILGATDGDGNSDFLFVDNRRHEKQPLLSKVIGDANAAYSLRDLNDKQGENIVVRLRRENSNSPNQVEKDFRAKEIKDVVSWADGGDARVVKWYDQSGKGNHLESDGYRVQGDTSSNNAPTGDGNSAEHQPFLVEGGTLNTINGKPAIHFKQGITDVGTTFLTTANNYSTDVDFRDNFMGHHNFLLIAQANATASKTIFGFGLDYHTGTYGGFNFEQIAGKRFRLGSSTNGIDANASYDSLNDTNNYQPRLLNILLNVDHATNATTTCKFRYNKQGETVRREQTKSDMLPPKTRGAGRHGALTMGARFTYQFTDGADCFISEFIYFREDNNKLITALEHNLSQEYNIAV
jgi:hypothetical protein